MKSLLTLFVGIVVCLVSVFGAGEESCDDEGCSSRDVGQTNSFLESSLRDMSHSMERMWRMMDSFDNLFNNHANFYDPFSHRSHRNRLNYMNPFDYSNNLLYNPFDYHNYYMPRRRVYNPYYANYNNYLQQQQHQRQQQQQEQLQHQKQGQSHGSELTGTGFDPYENILANYEPEMRLIENFPKVFSFSTDMVEQDGKYLVRADMPGLKKTDIKIRLVPTSWKGCRLEIDAKKEENAKEEKDDFVHRERQYGEYSRNFILPDDCLCDKSKVQANYKQGVLEIELPKSQEKNNQFESKESHVNVA